MADVGGMDTAGAVAVDVYPDGRRFGARLREEVLPPAEQVGRELASRLSAPVSEQMAGAIREGVRNGGRAAQQQAARDGEDVGQAFGRAIRERVERAVSGLPKVELDADAGPLTRKLQDVRRQLEGLSDKRVGIDISTDEAIAKVQALRNTTSALSREIEKARTQGRQGIEIDADALKAMAELTGLKRELTALQRQAERPIQIKAELDRSFEGELRRRLGRALASLPKITLTADSSDAERKLAELRARLAALSEQTIGVDVDAGEALRTMAAVQTELTALSGQEADVTVRTNADRAQRELAAVAAEATAVGAMEPTVEVDADTSRAMSGMSALIAVGVALGPAIIPGAAAAAAAVGAIGIAGFGAAAGIGSVLLAMSGPIEAVKAMGAAEGQASQQAATLASRQDAVAAATDQVRSAQQSVAEAQRQVTRAEAEALRVRQELSQAQEDARRAAEDLTASVKSNALAQRQANLDVAAAKAQRDAVLNDPRATEAQQEQARIAYEREVLQQQDLSRQGKRLAQEKADNDRKGIQGSDQVVAARQRIAAADERVHQAQQGLARAQQQVISAQRALGQASVAAGTAGSAAMTKLNDSMAALSPEGRRFARFLFGLKDEWLSLKRAAEAGFLPGLETAMKILLPYMPQLRKFIGAVATALGDMAVEGAKALKGPFWKQFFSFLASTAVPALKGMFEGGMNLAKGFAALLQAFFPVNKQMGKGLLDLTKRFADWATGLSTNKGFQEFTQYLMDNGPVVGKLLLDLAVVVLKLIIALAPLGAVVLKGLGALFAWLAKLDPGVLLAIVYGVAALVAVLITMALGPVAAITAIVVAIVALAGVLVYAYNRVSWFHTAVDAVWHAIAAGATWLWQTVLQPAFTWLVDFITNTLAPAAVWLWRNVLQPAFQGIAAVVVWAWQNVILPALAGMWGYIQNVLIPVVLFLWRNVIKPVFLAIQVAIQVAWAIIQVIVGLWVILFKTVLGPAFTWLYRNAIKPALDAIGSAATWVWEHVLKPVFTTLGDFVRDHVAPAFRAGISAVETAWKRIQDVAKIPVKFVIERVLNDGIIGGFNWLADKVGVDKIAPVKLPPGFARGGVLGFGRGGVQAAYAGGGVLPGYTPGRDVHTFYSPTGGSLALSGGEAVMRPEFTAALGASAIDLANLAARRKGIAGVREWLLSLLGQIGGDPSSPLDGYITPGGHLGRPGGRQGYLGGFAKGGILGTITGAVSKAWDAFTDPVGALKSGVSKLFDLVPGAGLIRGAAVKASRMALDGAVGWLSRRLMGAGGEDYHGPISREVSAVQAWIKSQAGKPYIWASAGPVGYDCSGLMSAAYNILSGRPPHRHTFSTHVMGDYFDPGRGVFTAGWSHAGERGGGSVGHTAGALAGLKFESRGSRGVVVGPDATPVTDFARLGHMPGLAGGGVIRLYDSGGWLPQGISVVENRTGTPEPVLSAQQWEDMRILARSGAGGGPAPLVGSLTLAPAPEPVADQMDEVAYALRRIKRGGVHAR